MNWQNPKIITLHPRDARPVCPVKWEDLLSRVRGEYHTWPIIEVIGLGKSA